MKKSALLLLASLMLVILCSFRVQPEQALNTKVESIAKIAIQESHAVDCMASGLLAASYMFAWMEATDEIEQTVLEFLWKFWFTQWLNCIIPDQ